MQLFTGVRPLSYACAWAYLFLIDLAILRGAMVKDGCEILVYKQEFMDIIKLLVDKTYSKRGYQWASRLLYSILLACTNTYPLDDRFVNVDEWHSPGKNYCEPSTPTEHI